MTRFKCVQANGIVHPEPLVLLDFALASKMMNMKQFPVAVQDMGVLARDDAEQWQRDLKAADSEGRFMFAGRVLAVVGGQEVNNSINYCVYT